MNIIKGTKVVSEPGAAITVRQIELTKVGVDLLVIRNIKAWDEACEASLARARSKDAKKESRNP